MADTKEAHDEHSRKDTGTEAERLFRRDRDQARTRVQNRRDFGAHLAAYVIINSFLIGIWAMTGAGYFWPVWLLGTWGPGLVLHAWDAFIRRPVTDADIEAELRRLT